jgi:serine protease Do
MKVIEYSKNNAQRSYIRVGLYLVLGLMVLTGLNLSLSGFVQERISHSGLECFAQLFVSEAEAASVETPTVPHSFSDLAEEASPAVVNIRTVKIVKSRGKAGRPFGKDPFSKDHPMKDFFDRFFGPEQHPDFKQRSLGSGFIIDSSGYVVTNNHVVEDADKIKVFLRNEKEYDAQIVGRDANTDIALIKIMSDDNFPVVQLGDSDELKVGQWVVAIGNPFGLGHTVTAGIVSAKGRVIGSGPYDDYIQTDASINPGNSGGPLLNMQGRVVGINTIIIAGGQGIGFAIPINLAKEVVSQLQDSGEVTRGWLGVSIQDLPKDLADYFGIEDRQGVLIADVVAGDPADKAGIRAQDIVLEINGEKIKDSHALLKKVANLKVGEIAKLKVLRDGKTKVFDVKVAKRDDAKIVAHKKPETIKSDLGIKVSDLSPEISNQFNISDTEGVVVVGLESEGKGAEAGIHTGDIVKGINQKEIRNLKDYNRVMGKLKDGDAIAFLIKRHNFGFIVIKLVK